MESWDATGAVHLLPVPPLPLEKTSSASVAGTAPVAGTSAAWCGSQQQVPSPAVTNRKTTASTIPIPPLKDAARQGR